MSGSRGQSGVRTGLGDVPNPDYEELQDLLEDVRGYQRLNSDVLSLAAYVMGSGGAWTGPSTASAFEADLQGRHSRLPVYFDRIVEAVEFRMSQVPTTVNVLGG